VISRNSINGAYPVKRLGEVVEFLDSKRRPVTESDRRAGPYPYYGANGMQGTVDDFIFDEPLVLLAEDGGHFGEPDRGIAYRISGKTWVNNHAHVLRPKSTITLAYLCRVLENYDVTPFVTGTTRGKLTKAGASEIVIPLPPLVEQRRIAKVLDRAEALRAKRRAALAQLDSLTQSLFLDLFGDPTAKGWAMTDIVGVAKDADGSIRTGPFGSQLLHGEFTQQGIAVLGIDNAVANEFRWGERRFISEAKYRQLQRYTVRPGDVLITIMGTCGRCAVVPDDIPSAINTKHLCCITLDPAKCLPVFLHAYFLQHPIARKYLNQTAKGAIMSGLNMGLIKRMPVPLPPIPLQRQFARQVTAVEALKTAQRASLAELDALFATLQHRAFRGEL
jgi:type I restriction enzyme, S subunit